MIFTMSTAQRLADDAQVNVDVMYVGTSSTLPRVATRPLTRIALVHLRLVGECAPGTDPRR